MEVETQAEAAFGLLRTIGVGVRKRSKHQGIAQRNLTEGTEVKVMMGQNKRSFGMFAKSGNRSAPLYLGGRIRHALALLILACVMDLSAWSQPNSFRTDRDTASFTFFEGNSSAQTSTINVLSSGSGLAYSASATAPWLRVSPDNGTLPASLQVSVDPATLRAGSYTGTIVITAPQATPASRQVTISVIVQPPASPKLGLSSGSLSFSMIQGGDPNATVLTAINTGGGSLAVSFESPADADWLKISPATGAVTSSQPLEAVVTVTPGSLPPGVYRSTITVKDSTTKDLRTIPLTMSISASQKKLFISQTSLSFIGNSGGGRPLQQTFGILNLGSGSLNWNARVSSPTGAALPWLSVFPESGTVARPYLDVSNVSVEVNPGTLPPGEYYGQIQVTAGAADNSPQRVSVLLVVRPPGSLLPPEVRPSGIIFTAPLGSSADPQALQLSIPGIQPLDYNSGRVTLDGQPWFSHNPQRGTVFPDQTSTVRVQPDLRFLAPGVYNGVITFQFSDNNVSTARVLTVIAPGTNTTSGKNGAPAATGCASPELKIEFTSLRPEFAVQTRQGVNVEVKVVDNCGNPLVPNTQRTNTQVVARFSNGDPSINLTHTGNGSWSGTWKPVIVGLTARVLVNVIAVFVEGALAQTVQAGRSELTGTIREGGNAPLVTADGVVHGASFIAGGPIAPGSLISLFGENLADRSELVSGLPLPLQRNGTEVRIGDLALPILYTSRGQLNVQVPYDLPVNTQHQISVRRSDSLSVPEQLTVAAAQPGIFTSDQSGRGQGIIMKSDGVTLAQPGSPASPGETIVIYCTGLGAVSPTVDPGTPAPTSPLSRVTNDVSVSIGGKNATVLFGGLTPGYSGLYQVNAIVPDGVSLGNAVPVLVTVASQSSIPVTMAIR